MINGIPPTDDDAGRPALAQRTNGDESVQCVELSAGNVPPASLVNGAQPLGEKNQVMHSITGAASIENITFYRTTCMKNLLNTLYLVS